MKKSLYCLAPSSEKPHLISIHSGNQLKAVGCNISGQLGNGSIESTKTLTTVSLTDVGQMVSVVANVDISYALLASGQVIAWGSNTKGQLGFEVNELITIPALIPELKEIQQVVCGTFHAIALDNQGIVWITGDNLFGQQGRGDIISQNLFTPVTFDDPKLKIHKISAGCDQSFAIDSEGHLWAWGANNHGELGLNSQGNTTFKPTLVTLPEGCRVKTLFTGFHFTILLSEEGRVYSCGSNDEGQLGHTNLGTTTFQLVNIPDKVLNIQMGYHHALALDENGHVWGWGNNSFHQINQKDICNYTDPFKITTPKEEQIVLIACGANESYLLTKTNKLLHSGTNFLFEESPFLGMKSAMTAQYQYNTSRELKHKPLQPSSCKFFTDVDVNFSLEKEIITIEQPYRLNSVI